MQKKIVVRRLEDVRTSGTITSTCEAPVMA